MAWNGLEVVQKLGFDKANMNAAIDESLKRLKTEYIDLYQLHWLKEKYQRFGFRL